MAKKLERIGILTSGGDCPGMNAGIRAAVRTGLASGLRVTGIRRGYQGLIDGDVVEMDHRSVAGIISRGGTILQTARCQPFYEREGREKAAETCSSEGIDGLVAFGGDGTFRGAAKLAEETDIRIVGVPGTIDNDIPGTDFTVGFDTAINTAVCAIDRIRDTATSHERLFLVEVMGRDSGFIALYAGIAGGAEEILVPETPTDVPALARELERGKKRGKSSSIVIVAEGDEAGDALEIARQLAELAPVYDTRVSVLGHQQRGGSPTAFDRVLASRLCNRAVKELIAGSSDIMVGVRANEVVTEPISISWEGGRTKLPEDLLELYRTLAT